MGQTEKIIAGLEPPALEGLTRAPFPADGDFITEGDPKSFGEDFHSAVLHAESMSYQHKMVELRMERMVEDNAYTAPVTFWSERYENGKKMWRQNWR